MSVRPRLGGRAAPSERGGNALAASVAKPAAHQGGYCLQSPVMRQDLAFRRSRSRWPRSARVVTDCRSFARKTAHPASLSPTPMGLVHSRAPRITGAAATAWQGTALVPGQQKKASAWEAPMGSEHVREVFRTITRSKYAFSSCWDRYCIVIAEISKPATRVISTSVFASPCTLIS